MQSAATIDAVDILVVGTYLVYSENIPEAVKKVKGL